MNASTLDAQTGDCTRVKTVHSREKGPESTRGTIGIVMNILFSNPHGKRVKCVGTTARNLRLVPR